MKANSEMDNRIINALRRVYGYIEADCYDIGVTKKADILEMAADGNRIAMFDKDADKAFYAMSTKDQNKLLRKV